MSKILRECFIKDDVVCVPLANGSVAFVDVCDYELVKNYNWLVAQKKKNFYARTSIKKGDRFFNVTMHRLILGLTDPKIMVDHKDGNGLNNKRDNLRICTNQQNQFNRKAIHRTSKYKGVHYKKQGTLIRRWRAMIKLESKTTCIGSFLTEEEAAIAYDKAALKHFGEFAFLNFESSRLQETKDDVHL